jgi:methylated-DNA-[protein]-cysteine S-methyltransferase
VENNRFTYRTGFGPMTIQDDGDGRISHLSFSGRTSDIPAGVFESDVIGRAGRELSEYLDGTRRVFDIPLNPRGTAFQLMVWDELRKVPYGTTVSYKDLAVGIGRPDASRAVGMAMNRNPIPIIVPCHRVIGSDGSMTGFAYGIDMKERLLRMEGAI